MMALIYRLAFLVMLFLLPVQQILHAQVYRRDSSFNGTGFAMPTGYNSSGAIFHHLKKVLVQPDGKTLLVGAYNGQSTIEIVRLNVNGTVDATFGVNGYFRQSVASGSSYLSNAALAIDGKILVLSYVYSQTTSSALLMRINTNGTVDNTFGSGGYLSLGSGQLSSLASIVVQPDGKIVLGGARNVGGPVNFYMIFRISANGSLDNSFGTNGKIENAFPQFSSAATSATCINLQRDGKIILATYISGSGGPTGMAVLRFKVNGIVDSTFAQNGCYTYGMIEGTHVTPSGIVADSATGDIYTYGLTSLSVTTVSYLERPFITKLTSTGAVGTNWGTGGYVTPNLPLSQTLLTRGYPATFIRQPDGKFIIAGGSDSSATCHTIAYRLTAAGQLDNTFCNAGVLELPRGVRDVPTDAVLQKDGDIVFGGFTFNKANTGTGIGTDTNYMYCIRVTTKLKPVTGIGQTRYANGKMYAYPNPANNSRFHIRYEGLTSTGSLNLQLYDVTGRLAATQSATVNSTDGAIDFVPAQSLPAGIYTLKISSESGIYPPIKMILN